MHFPPQCASGERWAFRGQSTCTHLHSVESVPVREGGHPVDTAGVLSGLWGRAHGRGSVERGQILKITAVSIYMREKQTDRVREREIGDLVKSKY